MSELDVTNDSQDIAKSPVSVEQQLEQVNYRLGDSSSPPCGASGVLKYPASELMSIRTSNGIASRIPTVVYTPDFAASNKENVAAFPAAKIDRAVVAGKTVPTILAGRTNASVGRTSTPSGALVGAVHAPVFCQTESKNGTKTSALEDLRREMIAPLVQTTREVSSAAPASRASARKEPAYECSKCLVQTAPDEDSINKVSQHL